MMKKLLCLVLALTALLCAVACKEKEPEETPKAAYTLVYNGQELAIDAAAKAVIDAIGFGAPATVPTCGIGDLDRLYLSNGGGLQVRTYELQGVEYFYTIMILDDNVATKEGVAIGDSAEKVKSTYGEPSRQDSAAYIYSAGGMTLTFFLEEETVNKIVYMRAEG